MDIENYETKDFPPTCPICGNSMRWSSDFMASEQGFLPEDTKLEDDVLTHDFDCPHCGSTTIFDDIDGTMNLLVVCKDALNEDERPDDEEYDPTENTLVTDYALERYLM